jgi:hypothetical protein
MSQSMGIFPEQYEEFNDTLTAILVLSIFYLLGLLYQFYNLVQMFSRIIKVLWT